MAGLKLNYSYVAGAFAKGAEEHRKAIAAAATAAVREAGDIVQREGRADIAGAGFRSADWVQGFQATMIAPKPGQPPTINAATLIRHRLGFASIFETGGTIFGKPLLWLPIEANLPPGQQRWTPRRYVAQVGPLRSVNVPGRKPMLVSKAVRSEPGRDRRRALLGKTDPRASVPLFVGVPSVTISRRFHIRDIVKRAAGRLAELYSKNLMRA